MSKSAIEGALAANDGSTLKSTILGFIDSDKSKDFQAAMNVLVEKRAPSGLLMSTVHEAIEKISKISDASKCVDYLNPLCAYLRTSPNFEKEAKEIEPLFVTSCEKGERFAELATYYDSLPFNEDEHEEWDILEHHLKISECYQKAGMLTQVKRHSMQLAKYIFRARTPKPLLERYDLLRAHIAIDTGDYIQACRSFMTLANSEHANSLGYLRQAIVYVVLAAAGPARQSLFNQIMADERSKTLKVTRLLVRLNQKALVMASDLKEFEDELKGEYGFKMDVLQSSVKEHNLHGISQLYSSISLPRLAEIVGTTVEEVTTLVTGMINTERIRAKIDQPTSMVLYENELTPDESKDQSINMFCRTVASIANTISSH